jgi:GT2 family glycosyltransferase
VRPLVGIVVVNWNGGSRTAQCVRSLMALHYDPLRICIVDNDSTDDSIDQLVRQFPNVEIVRLGENRGFAGGCNAGMEWAIHIGADYVWLLNNDTTVDPAALSALVQMARSLGRDAILAPLVLHSLEPERVWSAGGRVRWPWLERAHIGIGDSQSAHQVPARVDWVSGCSVFFAARVAEIVGPFDERYFLYLEDVEWCLRARNRGVECWFTPGARVWHDVSDTVGRLDSRILRYYVNRNYMLLASTHGGPIGRAWALGRLLITLGKSGVRLALFPSYRRDPYYRAQVDGLLDFLRRRSGKAAYHDEPPAAAQSREGHAVS